ncbi:MAG TPA: MDR family MFS transporter [Stellaceae bacterium]|nr:MDR family MFS transporter [Stellaceae bacterium]
MDQTVAANARPAVIVPHRRLVLGAALIATFMPAVESSIVATAMPTIVGDLGGFDLFSWVFGAYLLTMAVMIPIYGRLADVYGRKRVFFVGTGIFMIGTALCGLATSMPMLIVFRAIQGFGGGAVQPISMTILGDIYTPAERARVQGYSSSVFGISAIIGPALGAFLVQHVHWSVVFWINVPIGVVSSILFAVLLPERIEQRAHQIDYLGGLLLVAGVGSVMGGLIQAAAIGLGKAAALVAVGVASLVVLGVYEQRLKEPMLPLALWRRRVVLLCNLAGLGAAATMMSVSALLPTYVQGVIGRGPGVVGLVVGATSVSWMFAAFAAGRLMIRTSYRVTAGIGGASLVIGTLTLTLIQPSSSPAWATAAAFVVGIGMGFCNTTFLVAIQADVAFHQRGLGTSSQMFMRIIGQSLGAASFGAVVNFGVDRLLPGSGHLVNRMLEPGTRATLSADQLARLSDAVGIAAHYAFVLAVVIAGLTLLAGLALPRGLSPVRTPV